MADKVVDALKDSMASPITVMGAPALGDTIGHQVLEALAKVGCTHTKMVRIDLICNDESIEEIKETIIETAKAGHKGDGLIAFFQLRKL